MAFIIVTWSQFFIPRTSGFVLKEAFGSLPKNDIKVIKHSYGMGFDSQTIYLKLSVNEEDFDGILKKGFDKTDKDKVQKGYSSDRPAWYTPLEESDEFYQNPNNKFGFSSWESSLVYNRKDNIAYFHYIGLD